MVAVAVVPVIEVTVAEMLLVVDAVARTVLATVALTVVAQV